MKNFAGILILFVSLSTHARAESACGVGTIILLGPFCLLLPSGPDDLEPSNSLKLKESDTVQFWEPSYLQAQTPLNSQYDGLRFYALPQVLGAQFTHPSAAFTNVDPSLTNKFSGASTRGFFFYGGQIGLYLSEFFSLDGALYMGSGAGGNSLENSAAGGFIDRVYSMKMYQGGFTFYLAKILYFSAFAGYRSTDIHSNLGYLVGNQFKRADVVHVKYDKFVYGFGLGFNFEIADHLLIRIGANIMPQFISDYGFSRTAQEHPLSLQAGVGVIF